LSEKVIDSVVCPFCGSLCDDTEVVIKDGRIVETRNMCVMGTNCSGGRLLGFRWLDGAVS
jgi:formylmethanofuran dehydrogenase subunit B